MSGGEKQPISVEFTDSVLVRNEFAMVQVRLDSTSHDPLLMIRDMHSGAAIFLDPLELEALTRFTHEQLKPLLDPSGPVDPDLTS